MCLLETKPSREVDAGEIVPYKSNAKEQVCKGQIGLKGGGQERIGERQKR